MLVLNKKNIKRYNLTNAINATYGIETIIAMQNRKNLKQNKNFSQFFINKSAFI